MDRQILENKISSWCEKLTLKAQEAHPECIKYLAPEYSDQYNSKYVRIYYTRAGQGKATFAFVDYNGNIYKCASWAAPAKGIRGHIDNPPLEMRELYR